MAYSKKSLFVIQKHAATTMHFDFRLEINGTLVSWALPKGPSTNPQQKRLAIRTDNHPLSYALFEGVLPEKSYGAGVVMIWDTGYFKPMPNEKGKTLSLKTQLLHGQINFFLEGTILYGGYALIQTKNSHWLLIKTKDAFANKQKNVTKKYNRSVLSGMTMHQIKRSTLCIIAFFALLSQTYFLER